MAKDNRMYKASHAWLIKAALKMRAAKAAARFRSCVMR